MTNVAHNWQALFNKVEDLMQKSQKHFNELHKAQDSQRIAESKLYDAEIAIKKDQTDL